MKSLCYLVILFLTASVIFAQSHISISEPDNGDVFVTSSSYNDKAPVYKYVWHDGHWPAAIIKSWINGGNKQESNGDHEKWYYLSPGTYTFTAEYWTVDISGSEYKVDEATPVTITVKPEREEKVFSYPIKRNGTNVGIPSYLSGQIIPTVQKFCEEQGYDGYDSYLTTSTSGVMTYWTGSSWAVTGGNGYFLYEIVAYKYN